jgi:hypothetical protein
MKKYIFVLLLTMVIGAALVLNGCNSDSNEDPNSTSIPQDAQSIVSLAKNDLAQKLDKPLADVAVYSLTEVKWYDTSLGSPQPGTAYAQVITPGYIINLEFNGQIYEYHTDKTNLVVFYENGIQYPASASSTDGVITDSVTDKPTGIVIEKTVPPPMR